MFSDAVEDLVGLSDEGLDALIRLFELQHRVNVARMACAVAVADVRQLIAVDGHLTMKGYLRATCGWSNHEVAKMRSLAGLVDRRRVVGDALLSGRIGGPQAFELAKAHGNRRVRDRFGEFASLLVGAAEELFYDDFCVAVQRFTLLADPDGAYRDVGVSIENRNARMVDIDGSIDFRVTGGDPFVNIIVDADTFARVMTDAGLATDTNLDGEDVDPFTGLADNDDLLDDVVDDLVDDGLDVDRDTDADPSQGTTGTTSPAGLLDRRCETTNGVVLHPHHVLRAALAGHVRRVVVNSAGVIIDQGRKQRLFTGSARQAAMLLVKHYEHPGCDLPAEW